ncbi:MAG: sigma-54-dependent Fis family transcriptional regulator [Fibrobacteria bacterium]|nr:sigma-54-dependent Fis family transcriptional regulator [Fibrobacteria bacterium]
MTSHWLLLTPEGARFPLERKLSIVGSAQSGDIVLPGCQGAEVQLLRRPDHVVAEPLVKGVAVDGRPAPPGIPVELVEKTEIRLSNGTVLRLDRPRIEPRLPVEPVLEAVDALLEADDPSTSLPRLLEFAGAFLDADGGILLEGEEGDRLVASWPMGKDVSPSRSAVQASLAKGGAILWSESATEGEALAGPSLRRSDIRSILCAPIRSSDSMTPLGCLYLHRTGREDSFSSSDLTAFDRLLSTIARVLGAARRHLEDRRALDSLSGPAPGMLAFSPNILATIAQAKKFASATVPLLVLGETGTGKERLAQMVHSVSPRAQGPFVAINCAAIPESLMESELFGHEKGAFTGATSERAGLFESARGGTLFLDEIGELAPQLQAALLRALQEKTIRRVGSSREIAVDVRIVAATHRDLESLVREGRFRQDLLFRLNVASVRLPPLRDRSEDILPMARVFAQKAAREFEMPFPGLSRAAEKALLRHSWPGNVRELENCLQRALLLSGGERIQPDHLGLPEAVAAMGTLAEIREAAERAAVESAMTKSGGNLTQAGSILGIDRKVLRDLLRRLGMYESSLES